MLTKTAETGPTKASKCIANAKCVLQIKASALDSSLVRAVGQQHSGPG